MKKLFKIILTLTLALIMVFSAACNANRDPDTGGEYLDPSYDGYISEGYTKGDLGGDIENPIPIQSGQITCGALNDAKNYEKWLALFKAPAEDSEEGQENGGAFYSYLQSGWSYNTLNMVKITVTNDGKAVPYAQVAASLGNSSTVTYGALSDANGVAVLFLSAEEEYTVTASKEGKTQSVTLEKGEKQKEIELAASTELSNAIDLMFVIDTTGSMGDELRYLQSEIEDVVNTIKQNHPQADIKIALLFYRDNGDDYVARCFNFESNINKVNNNLKAQKANGGGDYEEAVDLALYLAAVGGNYTDGSSKKSITFDWREDSTKILIHLLDAPPHDGETFEQKYFAAINALRDKGIRIITVASSGVNGKCEYLCRTASLITQGRYVFLTNHSGIGGDHKEPEAEDYVVEYLNKCLVRLIEELHTGVETEPAPINQKEN